MRMSLKELLNQGRLRPHKTSKEEITNLLKLVKRDIEDAKVSGLSSDRKFATAYNAVLQSATILLYCKGYRTSGMGHHFTVFEAMKEILGKDYLELADYFDSCRAQRNLTDYSYPGEVSFAEAEELIQAAEDFLQMVLNWLKNNYPNLLEGDYANT
jgi:uncharacterized protein (UPF0332 family)